MRILKLHSCGKISVTAPPRYAKQLRNLPVHERHRRLETRRTVSVEALNCETAGIGTHSGGEENKDIALVKLRWWMDHLESMFTPTTRRKKSRVPEHPIARCINAVATHAKEVMGSDPSVNETRYVTWSKRAIEARMEDVEKDRTR